MIRFFCIQFRAETINTMSIEKSIGNFLGQRITRRGLGAGALATTAALVVGPEIVHAHPAEQGVSTEKEAFPQTWPESKKNLVRSGLGMYADLYQECEEIEEICPGSTPYEFSQFFQPLRSFASGELVGDTLTAEQQEQKDAAMNLLLGEWGEKRDTLETDALKKSTQIDYDATETKDDPLDVVLLFRQMARVSGPTIMAMPDTARIRFIPSAGWYAGPELMAFSSPKNGEAVRTAQHELNHYFHANWAKAKPYLDQESTIEYFTTYAKAVKESFHHLYKAPFSQWSAARQHMIMHYFSWLDDAETTERKKSDVEELESNVGPFSLQDMPTEYAALDETQQYQMRYDRVAYRIAHRFHSIQAKRLRGLPADHEEREFMERFAPVLIHVMGEIAHYYVNPALGSYPGSDIGNMHRYGALHAQIQIARNMMLIGESDSGYVQNNKDRLQTTGDWERSLALYKKYGATVTDVQPVINEEENIAAVLSLPDSPDGLDHCLRLSYESYLTDYISGFSLFLPPDIQVTGSPITQKLADGTYRVDWPTSEGVVTIRTGIDSEYTVDQDARLQYQAVVHAHGGGQLEYQRGHIALRPLRLPVYRGGATESGNFEADRSEPTVSNAYMLGYGNIGHIFPTPDDPLASPVESVMVLPSQGQFSLLVNHEDGTHSRLTEGTPTTWWTNGALRQFLSETDQPDQYTITGAPYDRQPLYIKVHPVSRERATDLLESPDVKPIRLWLSRPDDPTSADDFVYGMDVGVDGIRISDISWEPIPPKRQAEPALAR